MAEMPAVVAPWGVDAVICVMGRGGTGSATLSTNGDAKVVASPGTDSG